MFVIFEDDMEMPFAVQALDVIKVEHIGSREKCEIHYKYGSLPLKLDVPKSFEDVVEMLNEAMSSSNE